MVPQYLLILKIAKNLYDIPNLIYKTNLIYVKFEFKFLQFDKKLF